jgi:protein O-mannosyl-transferase
MKRRKRSNSARSQPAALGKGITTNGAHSASPFAQSAIGFSGSATALALALVALAAIAAYHNSLGGAFLFDDHPWIVENTNIRHLWPIWPVLLPSNDPLVGGRPVVSLTLAVNYALGGTNVWGYHAVNLAIHILAAWTLLGIVRRTLLLPRLRERFGSAALPLALVAALVWALHPLQTESVTYVVQRTEALAALFYLLTLYCFLRGAIATSAYSTRSLPGGRPPACGFADIADKQQPLGTPARTIFWYIATVAACLLGMATKEIVATAPMIVLLYDRTFLAGSFREALRRRWGLYLALAATWNVVVLLLLSTGFYGGSTGFAVQKFTSWSYLLTQPGVIVHYIWLALWPSALCFDYNWPPPKSLSDVVLPAIVVVGLLGLTAWALVKWPAWGFLGAWFFVILAPTSSFVPIRDAAFDHRMYLSLAALAVGLAIGGWLVGQWLVDHGTISLGTSQLAGGLLATVVSVALGIATFQRNADYQSELSIWQDTVAKSPRNERAYNSLGLAMAECGRLDDAIAQYRKSLEIKPDYAEADNNLGMALSDSGRRDEAIVYYLKALDVNPNLATAHNNLGNALAAGGKPDEALAHFQKAVEIAPNFAKAHNSLGIALSARGQVDEAITHYETALKIRPDYDSAHNNLGIALAGRGRLDDAIAHFRKAIEIRPDSAQVQTNLGMALANSGQLDEAIVHFRKALELQPGYAPARKKLDAVLGQDNAPRTQP